MSKEGRNLYKIHFSTCQRDLVGDLVRYWTTRYMDATNGPKNPAMDGRWSGSLVVDQ